MKKKWELSDDGEFCYDDEFFSKETIVKILNNLETQIKTDKAVIKGYEKKLQEKREIIEELENHLIETETCHDETVKDDYLKGKEDAYLKVIDDHIDRITALELEKWYYEMELMNVERED